MPLSVPLYHLPRLYYSNSHRQCSLSPPSALLVARFSFGLAVSEGRMCHNHDMILVSHYTSFYIINAAIFMTCSCLRCTFYSYVLLLPRFGFGLAVSEGRICAPPIPYSGATLRRATSRDKWTSARPTTTPPRAHRTSTATSTWGSTRRRRGTTFSLENVSREPVHCFCFCEFLVGLTAAERRDPFFVTSSVRRPPTHTC